MCGPLKNVLHQITDTGLDGIHALTVSPIGDTPAELALDVISEDLIFNEEIPASVFLSGPVEGIASVLDELYTPRPRRVNYSGGCVQMGPVPHRAFPGVCDWMSRNGDLK